MTNSDFLIMSKSSVDTSPRRFLQVKNQGGISFERYGRIHKAKEMQAGAPTAKEIRAENKRMRYLSHSLQMQELESKVDNEIVSAVKKDQTQVEKAINLLKKKGTPIPQDLLDLRKENSKFIRKEKGKKIEKLPTFKVSLTHH